MKNQGFTLIELMIVIGFISLFLVLVVPRLLNVAESSDNITAAFVATALEQGAKTYAFDNTYPADNNARLDAALSSTGNHSKIKTLSQLTAKFPDHTFTMPNSPSGRVIITHDGRTFYSNVNAY